MLRNSVARKFLAKLWCPCHSQRGFRPRSEEATRFRVFRFDLLRLRTGIISDMSRPTRRELLAGPAMALLAKRLGALPLSQIKLGITTDEIDDDVLKAAMFLREHGLKWAEVRNIWGPYNTAQPIE